MAAEDEPGTGDFRNPRFPGALGHLIGYNAADGTFRTVTITLPGGKKFILNSAGDDALQEPERTNRGYASVDDPAITGADRRIINAMFESPGQPGFQLIPTSEPVTPGSPERDVPTARGRYGFLSNDVINQNHLGVEGWRRNAAAIEQNPELMRILKAIDDEHKNDPNHQQITQTGPDGSIRLTEHGVAHLQTDLKREYSIPASMVGRTDDLLGTKTITSLIQGLERTGHHEQAQAFNAFASRPSAAPPAPR
jgi:hypothetical protein